ncbi:MAG: BrnT family toxin [Terracidiphilus sp.]
MSRKHDDRIDIRGIDFEWYPPKAQSNLKKHKVSFQEASTIFGDNNRLEVPDREHSEEELRFIGVGRSDQDRLLFVNFTVRGDKVRIISARQAESWERREYEIGNRHE